MLNYVFSYQRLFGQAVPFIWSNTTQPQRFIFSTLRAELDSAALFPPSILS